MRARKNNDYGLNVLFKTESGHKGREASFGYCSCLI